MYSAVIDEENIICYGKAA